VHTIEGIVTALTSGKAMDYCPFSTFTCPTDIRDLVASLTEFNITPDNVPTSGLDTEEVKLRMTELAVTFFGTALKRVRNDRRHFAR
jgi:hypothetical protein